MTRDTEASLLQFCAAQRGGFDPDQWLACPHPDRSELTAAAL